MIIAIIVFAILLCIGMPIAIALGLFGITHIATMGNPAFFDIITGRMFSGVNIITRKPGSANSHTTPRSPSSAASSVPR